MYYLLSYSGVPRDLICATLEPQYRMLMQQLGQEQNPILMRNNQSNNLILRFPHRPRHVTISRSLLSDTFYTHIRTPSVREKAVCHRVICAVVQQKGRKNCTSDTKPTSV